MQKKDSVSVALTYENCKIKELQNFAKTLKLQQIRVPEVHSEPGQTHKMELLN